MGQFDSLTDDKIVAEAKKLYAQAEEIESKADSLKSQASEKKWGVAERCHTLVERGWSRRKVATSIGVNDMTIGVWVKMVEEYRGTSARPTFGEAYREIRPDAGTLETYRRHTAALAKKDPVEAANIVASNTTGHAQKAAKSAATDARKAFVREAMEDPEVARDLAEEGDVQEKLIEAKLDVAYQKSTGKKVRPKVTPKVEEDEGELRPGLLYLAIGTPLYRVRVNLIEALGHARESTVTDSVRELLMKDVDAIRELLVDLQLVLEGEKEISDEDIAAWLKQADDDLKERR